MSRSETDSCDEGNERLPGNTGRVFAVDGKYHSTVTASAERIPMVDLLFPNIHLAGRRGWGWRGGVGWGGRILRNTLH